ncbi:V-type proton ATPase subunit G3-like [Humulus lupulus]|uniref:V-type proton ATPase subunit G3-like n=1 Tax=Humulus lupulus TaxID=3486 RepID=UPI002B40A2AC|nr:V-type proton ATPase subunit G3-like [Humulus lupulus]
MDSLRSGHGGIQMLLTAEQEAQHIISSARNLRTVRLKQAKDEADQEMALYRSNMEADHQNRKSQTSSESIAKQLEEETQIRIQSLKESALKVSPDVVAMLLNYVTTVKN